MADIRNLVETWDDQAGGKDTSQETESSTYIITINTNKSARFLQLNQNQELYHKLTNALRGVMDDLPRVVVLPQYSMEFTGKRFSRIKKGTPMSENWIECVHPPNLVQNEVKAELGPRNRFLHVHAVFTFDRRVYLLKNRIRTWVNSRLKPALGHNARVDVRVVSDSKEKRARRYVLK
jgi:hypothetical protein